MEKKLYDASLKGDVEALKALIREDELILARVSVSSCFNQTPLHLASLLGHFEFAKSLLSYKPNYVKRLDSQGRSPLHLASANGYSKIVKLLLEQDTSLCRVRDEDGRTPLQLAVMNGEYESVKELMKVKPDLSFHDKEEKVLHLCVMYNRLNLLILIMESMDKDLSRIKDENGNTILHSATALKRTEIIRYLMSRSEVEADEVNGNGLTALDIIEQIPIDVKTIEIKELLVTAPAHRAKPKEAHATTAHRAKLKEAHATTIDSKSKVVKMWNKMKNFSIFGAKMEVRDESILVAASVIAAIAYQAAINPPGGVASMDAKEKLSNSTTYELEPGTSLFAYFHPEKLSNSTRYELEPGTSLFAYFHPELNRVFWISNTTSLMGSLIMIFLFVSGASTLKRRFFIWILRVAMWVTISAMALAYICAAVAITPSRDYHIIAPIVVAGLLVLVGLFVIAILVLVSRLVKYILFRIVYPLVSYIVIKIVYRLVSYIVISIVYRLLKYILIVIVYRLISYIVITTAEKIKKERANRKKNTSTEDPSRNNASVEEATSQTQETNIV